MKAIKQTLDQQIHYWAGEFADNRVADARRGHPWLITDGDPADPRILQGDIEAALDNVEGTNEELATAIRRLGYKVPDYLLPG